MLCDRLEWWDGEGGRETQEGGDMGIYVYVLAKGRSQKTHPQISNCFYLFIYHIFIFILFYFFNIFIGI